MSRALKIYSEVHRCQPVTVEEESLEPTTEMVETYGADTPVTGQTKMQAVWSADTGDEETSAKVASASQGQIFEQIYTTWEGTLNPRWMRNWAIFTPSYSWYFQERPQTLEHSNKAIHLLCHYRLNDRCCPCSPLRNDWRTNLI